MTHTNPKVTIIIPCYNREKYIADSIESVLNQTYSNIELVVVDDGCTDGSRAIIDNYADRIQILEHPGRANRGQSAALNLGIESTQSTYIGFLDSDDLFASEKIAKQVAYLEQRPNIGLVYGNGHIIDENNNVLYQIYSDNHFEESNPDTLLLDCYFLLPNNSLFRRSILKKSGLFDVNLRSAQDHDLALRISELTNISYIKNYLFFYRKHRNSISQNNAKLRWKNGYKILNKARKRYPYQFSTILRRLAVLNFRYGQCLLEEKKYFSSILFFLGAGACDPIRSIRIIIGKEKISSPH